jgi:hypothetical protein
MIGDESRTPAGQRGREMIPLTVYIQDASTQQRGVTRSEEVERMADEIRRAGGLFEVEILRSGRVFLEVIARNAAGEVVTWAADSASGSGDLGASVDRLVHTAHEYLKAVGKVGK